MPQVEVNCTVVNCIFHAKGDLCGAERIQVDMDERISKKSNMEFARDFDLHANPEKARYSFETCCNTFRPKDV
ncbi:DUF1540 domain-containing protein [Metasolibacillus sp. FSL H7-0170]|uniref:DUF1540 domain-containing protein n=1 Tax=Metasolibacillus TaxID=2703677 RepID=UPI00079AEC9E|nr:DUF1540 domain-containing protein [Metasolibacillus fluoroglycofenilyticus]KYG89887.1 hypothetical protein A0U40_09185 [[Bacillus] sp. KCTC 13219]